MKSKRVVAVSDLHCGHIVGLTHPDWQGGLEHRRYSPKDTAACQARAWQTYQETLAALQPIDVLMVLGDVIDGKGDRSGSCEQITTDRNEQVDMAAECIREARAKQIVMVYGTPYHTGKEDDFEAQVAEKVDARCIGSHEWCDVNGVVFDLKHKVNGSAIPHGRGTPLAREWLWNQLWAARSEQPKANVILRGHIHSFNYIGGPGWIAMSLPALQLAGTKYGGRQCSGLVDWGVVSFDIRNERDWTWRAHLPLEVVRRASAVKL